MKALIMLLLVGLAMPALAEAKKTPKITTDNKAIDLGMKEAREKARLQGNPKFKEAVPLGMRKSK